MENESEFFKRLNEKLEKCVTSLNGEFKSMQVGRANPAILNKVKVDYYGSPTSVSQIANISVAEARTLVISPWDITMLSEIEKAIYKANIGINPTNDGKVIRLVSPQLTGERRKEIVKEIGSCAESYRIKIRNIRKKALDDIKDLNKQGEISDDEEKNKKQKIQKLVDEHIEKIEQMAKIKSEEVKTV